MKKPCPGNNTCCNRDEFSRVIFPCSEARQEAVKAVQEMKSKEQPAGEPDTALKVIEAIDRFVILGELLPWEKKMRHTPGPWSVGAANTNVWAKEGTVLVTYLPTDVGSDRPAPLDERIANIQLIAAAPDLLEACQEMRKYLGADLSSLKDRGESLLESVAAKVHGAIKKAEGQPAGDPASHGITVAERDRDLEEWRKAARSGEPAGEPALRKRKD